MTIIPSINIHVTDKCNLRCVYCPESGESLFCCNELCDINSILCLLRLARRFGLSTVRITGGEPLLEPERTRKILDICVGLDYQRIILNTNGTKILENIDWLDIYSGHIVMKISIDTLQESTFERICRKKLGADVHQGLLCAISKNYNIEINTVINDYNITEIIDLVRFADQNDVGIKLLTEYNYGGRVEVSNLKHEIDDLVSWLHANYFYIGNIRLEGNRGMLMPRFCTKTGKDILFVDHGNAVEPTGVFSVSCLECPFYPCITGRFHIPLRADGLLQSCRLRPDSGILISGKSEKDIESALTRMLNDFV